MKLDEFAKSTKQNNIPAGINEYLQALWYDAKEDWNKAHHIVQDLENKNAAWVHAYLHRKEGDISNADYWYHRAGRKRPAFSLDQEWEMIVKELINL